MFTLDLPVSVQQEPVVGAFSRENA
jgi:hypothetical protein